MKKYQYTEQERAEIAAARKSGDQKALAKLVGKIRKQCVAEKRVLEVEDNRKKKEKKAPADAPTDEVASAAEVASGELPVEVHGANESVTIK